MDNDLARTVFVPVLEAKGLKHYIVHQDHVELPIFGRWGACDVAIAPLRSGLWIHMEPNLFAEDDDVSLLKEALAINREHSYIKLGMDKGSGELVLDLEVLLRSPLTTEAFADYLDLALGAVNDLMPQLLRVKWGGQADRPPQPARCSSRPSKVEQEAERIVKKLLEPAERRSRRSRYDEHLDAIASGKIITFSITNPLERNRIRRGLERRAAVRGMVLEFRWSEETLAVRASVKE